MTHDDTLKMFKEEYKKAYKDILSEDVLNKGNEWFESFLTSRHFAYQNLLVERIEGMKKEEDWNKIETDDYYASSKIKIADKYRIYNKALSDIIALIKHR